MKQCFTLDQLAERLEIIKVENGGNAIIVKRDLVNALSLMGYLNVRGKIYQLDDTSELWIEVVGSDDEKPTDILGADVRRLFNYVARGKDMSDWVLEDNVVRAVISDFKAEYNLDWLARERADWIKHGLIELEKYNNVPPSPNPKMQELLEGSKIDVSRRMLYDGLQEAIDNNEVVAVRNGIIDTRQRYNKRLIPHTRYLFVPDWYDVLYEDIEQITDKDGQPYNCTTFPCKEVGKSYYQIFNDIVPDEDTLRVIARYYCIPTFRLTHIDRLLFIYGFENTGKSTLRITISKLLGRLCVPLRFVDFMGRFGLEPFRRARTVIIDDAVAPTKESERVQLGELLKSATNNGDITIEPKGKNIISVRNNTQMMVITNHHDTFGTLSKAVMKRLIPIPCYTVREPIEALKTTLESNEAVNWLLNWLLTVYYTDLYETGDLVSLMTSEAIEKAKVTLYAETGGIIAKYIDEGLGIDPRNITEVWRHLYANPDVKGFEASLSNFCIENDCRCPSKNQIRAKIRKEYGMKVDQCTRKGVHYSLGWVPIVPLEALQVKQQDL